MTNIPFCLPCDMSPQVFLSEYWQKKPLLIKNGLPALKDLFEPDDILALASDDNVLARLISQKDSPPSNKPHWQVKSSPLNHNDFNKLPKYWTVLIQNLEQWSPELGRLWQAFDFIPKWQQDDIMVSYAPDGGSVGRHFDEYDVFLAQGYGKRHWQLGKMCKPDTPFIQGEPIRLLDEMGEIIFDAVLDIGDVLYVPPRLAHYGVAVGDCLTFSFGFRRPNLVQILDKLADVATAYPALFSPLNLQQTHEPSQLLSRDSIAQIKDELILALNNDKLFTHAISELVSRRQYELISFYDELGDGELLALLNNGGKLAINHASRFVKSNHWYINGEQVKLDNLTESLLLDLINGKILDHQAITDIVHQNQCDVDSLDCDSLGYDGLNYDSLVAMLSTWVNEQWLIILDEDELDNESS